jgi:DNA processing protein
VPYPRGNQDLFLRIREAGGTFLAEHPPGARPLAAHFLPRNRLIAALSGAVVVVEAALDSGSLATARAAGSRGAGQILAIPGAPWDRGAAGCNDLIRDGAILVRGLDDVLEALALPDSPAGPATPAGAAVATAAGATVAAGRAVGASPAVGAGQAVGAGGTASAAGRIAGGLPPCRPWPVGASRAAEQVLGVLADGRIMSVARLEAVTGLAPALVASALLELELAGFARRSAAGAEALALPSQPANRGPPSAR